MSWNFEFNWIKTWKLELSFENVFEKIHHKMRFEMDFHHKMSFGNVFHHKISFINIFHHKWVLKFFFVHRLRFENWFSKQQYYKWILKMFFNRKRVWKFIKTQMSFEQIFHHRIIFFFHQNKFENCFYHEMSLGNVFHRHWDMRILFTTNELKLNFDCKMSFLKLYSPTNEF